MTRAALFLLTGCAMSDAPRAARSLDPLDAPPSAGRLVVDLVDGTPLAEAQASLGLPLAWATVTSADEALAVVEVPDLAAAEARIQGNPLVELVETSRPMGMLGYPNDPLYDQQWNLRAIGAPAGWRLGAGAGVRVAVIDTGIAAVPDLEGVAQAAGISVVPGVSDCADDQGHGTHVAGTIAQATHNEVGVAGIAPRAELLAVKALDAYGRGTSEQVAAAIDAAVDAGADVLNLSLGGGHSGVVDLAVRRAQEAGVLVVAAAGNEGTEGVSCPAHAEGALAVSATGPDDALAPYSSWGAEIDLAAPGGDRTEGGGVVQDMPSSDAPEGHAFRGLQGTSMASPHVAGAAAVLLGAGLSPEGAEDLLRRSALDLGAPGVDPHFGAGRIDLDRAARIWLLQRGGWGAAAGLLLGGLVAALGRGKVGRLALFSAIVAGGLFFLPLLPLPPSPWVAALSRPLLDLPGAFGGQDWARLSLWRSGLGVLALTFVLGPTRSLGPWVGALAAGVAARLWVDAWWGGVAVSFLPAALVPAWGALHGALAAFCALAVAGAQKMASKGASAR